MLKTDNLLNLKKHQPWRNILSDIKAMIKRNKN